MDEQIRSLAERLNALVNHKRDQFWQDFAQDSIDQSDYDLVIDMALEIAIEAKIDVPVDMLNQIESVVDIDSKFWSWNGPKIIEKLNVLRKLTT